MRVNSIQLYIDETKKCLANGNNLAALIVALTIPDICGKVLYPNDKTAEKYKKWFDSYIGDYEQSSLEKEKPESERMPYMSGDVFYKLRCSMLHEGTDDISSKIQVDNFNLLFGKSGRLESKSIEPRIGYMPDGTIGVIEKVITWDINVYQLCEKILWSAEAFLKNECPDATKIPTIQIYPEIPSIFIVKK